MHSHYRQSLWQTLRNHPLQSLGASLGAAFIVASCTDWDFRKTGQEYPPHDLDSADQIIFFADIDSKGSPSMKALLRDFRKSSMGRDFYSFAVAHNMAMKWVQIKGARYTSFKDGGLIEIGIDNTQDQTILALGHEVQHGIQDKIYSRASHAYTVHTTWALVRLYEANACAIVVDYAAGYLKETGIKLDATGSLYGFRAIREFMNHSESQRNYKDHVVMPCLKELDGTMYDDLSLHNLSAVFTWNFYTKEKRVDDNEIAKDSLLPYFSRSPGSNQPDQSIKNMEAAQFFPWLHKITKPEDPRIQLMLEKIRQLQGNPAPAS